MSRIGRFQKDAQDRKRYVVDYEDWLDSSEAITAVTVTGDVSADGFLIDGFIAAEGGKQVIYFASGGVAGEEYNATITITTNMSQIKEDWITHVVT